MKLFLKDSSKKFIHVSDSVFNYVFNQTLIHQLIVSYKCCMRKGTKAQKSRSQVSGSGKKPWRQKGTGRARVGSIRSPIWRSGGVTFAASYKKYTKKVNKKMYRGAIKSIFSELIRQNRIFLFKDFYIDFPKTKLLINKLNNFNVKNVVILTVKFDKNIFLAARNLYKVNVFDIYSINPLSLINCEKVIITVKAIKKIEEMLI
ncbi:50S ribosomal protein L4 [Buchnera aphidicola]|uniref:50S ribosomal protein L4 n=1 Tax=Buchnera aphidicola TaxID=9 RepID=UPI0031B869A9